MKKSLLISAILALVTCTAQAQSIPKYFGYFGNADTSPLSEFQDHVNLYHIIGWSGNTTPAGREETTNYLLGQLALAKAANVHVILPAYPYVFQGTSKSDNKWQMEPNAGQVWADFVTQMIDGGYLIPGNPDQSTVTAIYLVDEPNITGLADVNNAPNPILLNAITAIRNNTGTAHLPIASIMNRDFSNIHLGMAFLDWVGFDMYGATPIDWQSKLNELKNDLPATSKIILVPQASLGGSSCGLGNNYDSSSSFNAKLLDDPQAIWLAPFVWFDSTASNGASCTGTRDIPALRAQYTTIGKAIKSTGCGSSPGAQNFCSGGASITPIINYLLDDN